MKTIKIAIWINVLFYISQLCVAAWIIFKYVTASKFSEIPSLGKLIFIAFVLLVHSVAVFCIIGLLRRKNWGRILTVVANIFISTGFIAGRIFDAMGSGVNTIQALTAHYVLVAYIIGLSLIALAVILLTWKAKSYFVSA